MPPLFLLGSEGMVWIFQRLRNQWPALARTPALSVVLFGLMGALLFAPMVSRTFLHAHGHFQEKVAMQAAFHWVGENSSETTTIVTQPMYAGQNDDWIRAGWRQWASRRYAQREVVSLRYPESWGPSPEANVVVVNRFWFEAENMLFEDTGRLASRFDSLRQTRGLELVATFEGGPEPLWLKKLSMLSYYPVDFMVFRPRFEVWRGPSL
jgi:hypothetical protein